MAATFEEALDEVGGREFDLAVRYEIPPYPQRAPEPEVAGAFAGIDYGRHFGWVVPALAHRFDGRWDDAQEATQDALVKLLTRKDRDWLRWSPAQWGAWIYRTAFRLLLRMRRRGGGVTSLDRLREVGGDAVLEGAEQCLPISLGTDEQYRYAPLPGKGEAWSRTQILGALQRFWDYHEREPKASDCRAMHQLPSLATILRHFRSLADALVAAGILSASLGRRTRWPDVEAADVCRRFRIWNGRWPDGYDAEGHPGKLPSRETMTRVFGGARAAEVQLGAEAILAADAGRRL